jgi:hypothetical protein
MGMQKMERRAAVEYLLKIAEKTDNSKFSTIVNDLARRVALSIEQKDVNLEKYCSKMAAELMFRDDYANANRLMKIAQDTKPNPDEILPLNEETPSESEEEQPVNNDFINKNLPPAPKKPVMPPLDANKLEKFLQDLSQGGATVTTKEEEDPAKDRDDLENNQDQMVEDSSLPQTEQQPTSVD